MITLETLLGLYIINFVSTYAIRCHVINKNVEDFKDLAKDKGIPDGLRDYMIDTLDKKPKWYDYIPIVNVASAIKDWIYRKYDMENLKGDIEHFESEYGPIEKYVIDTPDEHIEAQTEYREYFVGYFEEGKPIIIYFHYNGDENIVISNDCTPAFNSLDDNQKTNILMRILYEIHIGFRNYIACSTINEVFTDTMIQTLEQTFEGGNINYAIEKASNNKLVRNKSKNKK